MHTLHIFNPSHDEALAANLRRYTPARAARLLEEDLAALPALWAAADDFILCPNGKREGEKALNARLIASPSWNEIDRIEPWGWNLSLKDRLLRLGCPMHLLPSDEQLAATRNLSSRRTSELVLNALQPSEDEGMVGEAHCAESVDEVEKWQEERGEIVVKAPWSSSGRGIIMCEGPLSEAITNRIRAIIRKQGFVEMEPLYNKGSDFAMEFEYTNGELIYKGLSLFATNSLGAYSGNIIAEEQNLLTRLPHALHPAIETARRHLQNVLPALLTDKYEGPLGVDMMIINHAGRQFLHPCVEVNLRRTMGHVSVALRRLLPSASSSLLYRVRARGYAEDSRETVLAIEGERFVAEVY